MTTTPSPADIFTIRPDPTSWRHGIVAWFNTEKGFGFIEPDDHTGAVFVEYSSIEATGYKALAAGQPVVFTTIESPRGPEADRVRAYTRTLPHRIHPNLAPPIPDVHPETKESDGSAHVPAHSGLPHRSRSTHRPRRRSSRPGCVCVVDGVRCVGFARACQTGEGLAKLDDPDAPGHGHDQESRDCGDEDRDPDRQGEVPSQESQPETGRVLDHEYQQHDQEHGANAHAHPDAASSGPVDPGWRWRWLHRS